MCGIFAWAGKTPTKFRKEKLDILGIFNEERGKHSCGITLDGDIHIGIDGNKIYRDFLANVNYNLPIVYPSVIGHTRAATGGAHNIYNAHPFGYGNHKNGYRFVGVHNGTLQNHKELAKKYNVESTEKIDKGNYISYREKIDSEILLECIYKSNSYKVLSEYDGAAALIFCDLATPNITYFYHGKSKKYENASEAIEERPLFYWQETRNSVYVSSIKESLIAIGGEDKVVSFDYNTIYKVTDGNIEKAEKIKISREKCIQTQRYTINHNSNQNNTPTKKDKDFSPLNKTKQLDCNFNCYEENRDENVSSSEHNIYNDSTLLNQNEYGNSIYMNKLRYWRNGHLISGCYTWVPNFGFYFLDNKPKDAEKRFFDLVNKMFYKNDFINSKSEVPYSKHDDIVIPFVSTRHAEITKPNIYYFVDGIQLKTKLDYTQTSEVYPPFTWDQLSICSTHPVININHKFKSSSQQNINFNGVIYTGIICPMGSEKIYDIVNGNCVKITPTGPNAKKVTNKLTEVTDRLIYLEEKIAREEAKKMEETSEDLLDKDLEEFFKDSLVKFPNFTKRLENYKSNSRAGKAIEVFDAFIESATKLMSIDVND